MLGERWRSCCQFQQHPARSGSTPLDGPTTPPHSSSPLVLSYYDTPCPILTDLGALSITAKKLLSTVTQRGACCVRFFPPLANKIDESEPIRSVISRRMACMYSSSIHRDTNFCCGCSLSPRTQRPKHHWEVGRISLLLQRPATTLVIRGLRGDRRHITPLPSLR